MMTINTADKRFLMEERTDPNSVYILAHVRQEIEGNLESVFSARKSIYHNGYLIFINVVVDATRPRALAILNDYLVALTIESI